ncbi:enoyl-CoA hydratase/isomerase family protein [Xanthobacteraceae bacterium Astr-EGSB]|uniref:enoyl-CoA hydratase/isomerase family protein n=1 Tax=Astrobacterium formosum TaxID=3069710 RepID=UPI0027B21C18|nr:enoyl-CoA hydratase/isomerase family protein [Xanthobacteraceae bacterium Astr-EGSB]
MHESRSPDILFTRRGVAGIVTLDRPRALNSLTHEMVLHLSAQLDAWRGDPAVERVVVTAAGERAFCAGGDIKVIYEYGRSGEHHRALAFWRDEYALNTLIKRYPKPYVSLIDGIVMGGGVGISVHGSHRIAGERFVFAMPEVGIGLFPDVGGTWFLPRLAGLTGTYCALTGERLGPEDAVMAGVATHRVASGRFGALLDALAEPGPTDDILAGFARPAGEGPLTPRLVAVNRLFAPDRVEDIVDGLDAWTGPDADWAQGLARTIRTKAPKSLKIALAQMRRGLMWTFEDCMRAEFRLVSRFVYEHDFYEGVRAVVIDRDNRPQWRPATLAEVADADVEAHFAPIKDELELP